MTSLQTWRKSHRGFTVVELLLVVGIGAITLSSVAPFAGQYAQRQALETQTQAILAVLRDAQSSALQYRNDSSWGVYFNQSASDPHYVVFAGTAYDGTRIAALDRKTKLAKGFTLGGTQTIVFRKGDGVTAGGTVTVTNSIGTRTITIGAFGVSEIPSASSASAGSAGSATSTADLSIFLE